MLYAIHCLDKDNAGALRLANREAHLAYVGEFADRIFAAGPLLDDHEGMVGSLLIMDFADRSAAENFAANDPYRKAGLFASVSVMSWKKLLPG
jgi:uncharacterized protein YciI